MKKYKVYRITNLLNSKIYIGYTSLSLEKRLLLHKNSKTTKMPIVNSIRKYGIDNFKIDLLADFDDKNSATAHEIRLISEMSPDYNVHAGGTGGPMYGPMNGMFGKKHTAEWKENKRDMMTAEKNPMYGKTHTDDIKKLLSEKKLGNIPWNKNKKNVFSAETLQKLRAPKTKEHKDKLKKLYVFISPDKQRIEVFGLTEFCELNKLNKGAMSEVFSGKRSQYKGWKHEY